jgi:GNAT superfamily N-acetyltransferase
MNPKEKEGDFMEFIAPKYAREARTSYFCSRGEEYAKWDQEILRSYRLRFPVAEKEKKRFFTPTGSLTRWGKKSLDFAGGLFPLEDPDILCHLWNRFFTLFSLGVLSERLLRSYCGSCAKEFRSFLAEVSLYANGKNKRNVSLSDPCNPPLPLQGYVLVPTACLKKEASADLFAQHAKDFAGFEALYGREETRENIAEVLASYAKEGLAFTIEEKLDDPLFPDTLGGTDCGFIALKKDRSSALESEEAVAKPIRSDANLEITLFLYAPYRGKGIEEMALSALSHAALQGQLRQAKESEYLGVNAVASLPPKMIKAYLPLHHLQGDCYQRSFFAVETFLKDAFFDERTGPQDLAVFCSRELASSSEK